MLNVADFRDTIVLGESMMLSQALQNVTVTEGVFLEFGVHVGITINYIADIIKPTIIHGFDSFEGLPEDWDRGNGVYEKGHFKLDEVPEVHNNVVLVIGQFQDGTLRNWVHENADFQIAFLHVDSDLYSSAIYILETLNRYIIPGTIIVFDELCDWLHTGYPNWEEGEWRALCEWEEEYNRLVEPILRGREYQSVIRIVR